MLEIIVITYLVLSLAATFLIWTALVASKRCDDETQSMKYKSLAHHQFPNSKTRPVRFRPS